MQQCITQILRNEKIGHNTFKLILEKKDKEPWKPGNFLTILPEPVPPFFCWRRAFSAYYQNEHQLEIVIKSIGKVSGLLEKAKPGTEVSYVGPLGNSFSIHHNHDEDHILVGGGIGIAPLHFLAHHFAAHKISYTLLYGAATSHELLELSDLTTIENKIMFATEDGSFGYKGKVTELLLEILGTSSKKKRIYACGPFAMFNVLRSFFADPAIPVEISVETIMACGFGVCKGCAIPVDGNRYKMACKDGPIFDMHEILWEKWQ